MADGLAVPSDRPLDDLTAELTRMLGSPDPRSATAPPTPRWPPGSTAASTTTCSPASATAWPPACASASASTSTDIGLPPQLLGAGAGRVHRPRQRAGRWSRRQGPRVGRPDRHLAAARARPPRLRARQGLGARGRPRRRRDRRAGRARRTSAPPSSPCCSTSSPTGCCCPSTGSSPRRARPAGAGHDGGAAPQRASRCAVLEPWVAPARPPRPARRRRRTTTATRSSPAATPRPSCGRSTSSSRSAPEPPEVRSDLLLVLVDALRATNPHYLRRR